MRIKTNIKQSAIISILAIVAMLAGCAAHEKRASFLELPPTSLAGDTAWNIVVDSAKEYYPQIELADKKAGVIKSAIHVTDTCWAGILYGGSVPCKAERFIARVWSLNPFKADIAVQRHKATTMSNYRDWIEDGNNSEKEKTIYENIVQQISAR